MHPICTSLSKSSCTYVKRTTCIKSPRSHIPSCSDKELNALYMNAWFHIQMHSLRVDNVSCMLSMQDRPTPEFRTCYWHDSPHESRWCKKIVKFQYGLYTSRSGSWDLFQVNAHGGVRYTWMQNGYWHLNGYWHRVCRHDCGLLSVFISKMYVDECVRVGSVQRIKC